MECLDCWGNKHNNYAILFIQWLSKAFHVPGAGLFQYQTFRIAMSVILSLVIATCMVNDY